MLDFYRHIDATFYAPTPAGAVYAQWMMLFFASYLSMDLVDGMIYYKEKITLISGYLHHALYIFICNVSLWTGYTVPCAYLYFMEIPTAILGAEFIFPSLRDDNLFGLLFFIFRIVLDSLMAHETLRNTTMTPMGKFVTIIKNPLNVKFFVDYIQ
ncbi:hypothetical protein BGZ74_011603 [Mortierella antarctica]|nr:hypothetical protein BGZ74_011603 [Mortierella antarctica]